MQGDNAPWSRGASPASGYGWRRRLCRRRRPTILTCRRRVGPRLRISADPAVRVLVNEAFCPLALRHIAAGDAVPATPYPRRRSAAPRARRHCGCCSISSGVLFKSKTSLVTTPLRFLRSKRMIAPRIRMANASWCRSREQPGDAYADRVYETRDVHAVELGKFSQPLSSRVARLLGGRRRAARRTSRFARKVVPDEWTSGSSIARTASCGWPLRVVGVEGCCTTARIGFAASLARSRSASVSTV